MDLLILMGFMVSGLFTVVLGLVHFFMPVLFDFDRAILREGPPLKKLPFSFVDYRIKRIDVRGVAWVMNHAVSFTLVTLGVLDLLWPYWRQDFSAPILLGWMAAWWFLRVGTQLYMGRRSGDLWIMAGFTLLGLFHLGCVFL